MADAPFGSRVPYAEPAWYRENTTTPYYKPTHVAWRKRCRDFVEAEVIPNVSQWEKDKALPRELYAKTAEAGLLPCVVGAKSGGFELAGISPPDGFDYFHELIFIDELARCASGGTLWGLMEGLQIGLPPVLVYGTDHQKLKCKECLLGKKIICLAITESTAGSDVANLRCTAKKVGDQYIVSGHKKWITNGIWADYFSTAVRTGGPGAAGVSMLLVERTPEMTTTRMDCQGVWPSGTTFVEFNDVPVPAANLIGQENKGFQVIMRNFNHERWGFVVQANRFSRVLLEESYTHAMRRSTFGKKLTEHPVIRWKLAEMTRQVEAAHAWVEAATLQMNVMKPEVAATALGGMLALMKVNSTKMMEYCAREASQIFGGAAYTRSGLGEKVERLYRDVRAYAIPGGSEEIMLDLGVRQALRNAKL